MHVLECQREISSALLNKNTMRVRILLMARCTRYNVTW